MGLVRSLSHLPSPLFYTHPPAGLGQAVDYSLEQRFTRCGDGGRRETVQRGKLRPNHTREQEEQSQRPEGHLPASELLPAHLTEGCACVLKSLQSSPTLCNPVDCSPPGSSVHRILQARILEWVVIPFSRGCSQPRDGTLISCVSCIGRQIIYH